MSVCAKHMTSLTAIALLLYFRAVRRVDVWRAGERLSLARLFATGRQNETRSFGPLYRRHLLLTLSHLPPFIHVLL